MDSRISTRARAGVAALASLMLAGCFLAENDETDPIISADALAYPLELGKGQECELDETEGEKCAPARFEKLEGGGYSVVVWSENEEGEVVQTPPGQFRLRALVGASVPKGVYLAQSVDDNVEQRFLGLLVKRPEGGWSKIEPQCENLSAEAFVRFMTNGWLRTREGTTLKNATCYIQRDGLDDARLYAILSATRSNGGTIYYAAD